jgi:integrase
MKARAVEWDDKGKPTRWRVDLDLGMINGKRKRKAVYGHTERAALKRAQRIADELKGGADPEKERATMDALFTAFLDYSTSRVRPGTLESYRHIVNAFLRPAFGSTRARKLRAEDVDKFLSRLNGETNPQNGKPYAPSYLLKVHVVLKRALNLGQRWGYVAFNAAGQAEAPKVAKRKVRALTDSQITAILQAAAGHRYQPIYHLLIVTGLRRGEALGLRWEDIDLDNGLLSVTGTLQRIKRATPGDGEPKTIRTRGATKSDAGDRVLVLTPSMVRVLRRWKTHQELERSKIDGYGDSGYVFTSGNGGPVEPRQLSKHFKTQIVPAANLPTTTRVHDLRHANISAMISAGVDPKTAQERAGHADVRVTLGVYAHSNLDLQRAAAAAIDTRFGLIDNAA